MDKQITVLIKPASSNCNLQCRYCFYNDEVKNRENIKADIMSQTTVDNLISKIYSYCGKNSKINFMFQGGEPLIAPHEFYDYFTDKAISSAPKNSVIKFSLQTNGTLIDKKFCEIFKNYNFLIGVSLDGNKETHNRLRNNSFDDVMKGINLLQKYDVMFDIVSVITKYTSAEELFDFCVENNFHELQTIYCLNNLNGDTEDYSLDATGLARFKKRLFNKYYKYMETESYINIREFDNMFSFCFDGSFEQCGFDGRCTPQLVVEADGTCYPCDFYCLDDYKCLNINEAGPDDILKSKGMKNFLKSDTPKNSLCNNCEFYELCNGGCKRLRHLYNSEKGYCPQRDFLAHALPKIDQFLNED